MIDTPTPTSSTHQPDPIECREAFENWHDSLFDISARSSCKNEYGYPQDSAIQTRWQAWQACWNRPALAPVAMGEIMTSDKKLPDFPIQRLVVLREEMLRCSGLLKKYGHEEHGKEMFGAAKILLTWIEGISNEENI